MRKLVAICSLVVAGIWLFMLGRQSGLDHHERPQVKVVEVPHYIPGNDKVIEKKVFPQSCLDAAKAAGNMQKAIDRYEENVGSLTDLIDATGVAMHNGDQKKLNALREEQSKMEANSIQSLLDIREAQQRLDALQPKCTKDLK